MSDYFRDDFRWNAWDDRHEFATANGSQSAINKNLLGKFLPGADACRSHEVLFNKTRACGVPIEEGKPLLSQPVGGADHLKRMAVKFAAR